MAAIKTAFILLLVAFAMVMVTVEAVRVGPCDQVCSRIDAEKDECCRAHGWSGYSSCRYGQMQSAVAGPAMSPAALVLLSINTGADLVAGPDAGGLDGHHHHGEGDQQENEGGLDGGHFVCCLVVEKRS
ncbi:hypothetical protein PYW07_004777 [Mythimna separata]|uniref:Uncharacterized protein n=1 Tax=Mythimna separata TaxID=271217 RepID=A0AAD7YXR0_MYTSE|nr:hypothetical protein PYW07_004777 [Mythimna separata]